MSYYIGPERRKGERRRQYVMRGNDRLPLGERRTAARRQQALSGVIAGLTAEQMRELAEAWRALEATTRREA